MSILLQLKRSPFLSLSFCLLHYRRCGGRCGKFCVWLCRLWRTEYYTQRCRPLLLKLGQGLAMTEVNMHLHGTSFIMTVERWKHSKNKHMEEEVTVQSSANRRITLDTPVCLTTSYNVSCKWAVSICTEKQLGSLGSSGCSITNMKVFQT